MPCSRSPRGVCIPACPYPGPHPRGKLRGIRSRPTPKGEIEGDQIQAHTQGGNEGGSGQGPHPRKKWRGIRCRPTPKGEMEGDEIQAHTQGGNEGGSGPGPHPRGKWRGSDPGPHPRGKLRGFRSRPPPPPPSPPPPPPEADNPPPRSRHLPRADTPLPPKRRPMLRTLRILLECILELSLIIVVNYRFVSDHHGVRVLEEREAHRPFRLRPVLPQEPIPGRVHNIRRTRGMPQVSQELPLFGSWFVLNLRCSSVI